jgi:DDE superfamily endonuclease
MEDVLDVYTRPYDPTRPVVCMDETSKQLIGESRVPLPAQRGRLQRYDYEYVRHGVSNLFMLFEPLAARRYVKVTDRRTSQDWAELMRQLVDEHYPEAEVITVVLDNLNTHTPASLYETFEPEEARRIAKRLEFHYTPKHGSWLNPVLSGVEGMAEIELSVLSQQCLDRRIPDQTTLTREVAAWEEVRNQAGATVDWQFTTSDARIKLKKLYPSIQY